MRKPNREVHNQFFPLLKMYIMYLKSASIAISFAQAKPFWHDNVNHI